MLCHFSLVRRQILFHGGGLVQLEAVCVRVGRDGGVVPQCTVVGDVHPNGRMVPGEVAWLKVPTLDCGNVGSAPHAVQNLSILIPEESCGGMGLVVVLEDEVVHSQVGEELFDGWSSDLFI